MRIKTHRKLRLHRETLRRVSGPGLAVVAGGGRPRGVDMDPKSNAWTGDTEADEAGLCTVYI
jgi:hypothetical protein